MTSGEASQGWIVYSGGRRFGPLSEDELRNYFRAGMVKSVDRVSAPGDDVRRDPAEVARELGEPVPVGPPPPPIVERPAPVAVPTMATPSADAPRPADPVLDQRAVDAIAALQLQMATARPAERKRSGWMGPIVVGLGLVVVLLVGLNMVKKMQHPAAAAAPANTTAGYDRLNEAGVDPITQQAGAPARAVPMPTPIVAAGPSVEDTDFEESRQRAESLKNAERWAELVAYAKTWAQRQPQRSEPWQYIGLAQAQLSDFDGAAAAYAKVVEIEPGNNAARASLADSYLGAGKFAEAEALYQKLVVTDAGNARVWNNYGMTLRALHQDAQAAAAIETAVKIEPAFKQAWINLGDTYRAMGESSKAAAAFANAR
jgi:cytochrome c-type biogenesis protein CcmH/NrfG